MSQITLLIVFIIGAFVAYEIYVRRTKNPQHTELDLLIGHLKRSTIFFAVFIYVMAANLPAIGYLPMPVVQGRDPQVVLEQIIKNQGEIADALRESRTIASTSMILIGGYLFGLVGFISKLQFEREKLAIANDPELRKPLGL